MNKTAIEKLNNTDSLHFVTFRCGEYMVGLELTDVQEINRIDQLDEVPESPSQVRGVTNLRGEVVTMIDLRVVLHQPKFSSDIRRHNIFVHSEGEVIGLVTDGVSDILAIERNSIDPLPSNIKGTEAVLLSGVHTLESGESMVILDLTQVLSMDPQLTPAVAG